MESPTLATVLAAGAGALATLLLVAVVFLATGRRRSRASLEAMLAAAQRECDDLRHRLDELTVRPDRRGADAGGPAYLDELFSEPTIPRQRDPLGVEPRGAAPDTATFVITRAGEPEDVGRRIEVPDRLVLSATLGEPLIKAAAFSHGIRHALRAESRNRIWFEMRREVRAARKRRRRLVKDYLRETRAQERAGEGAA